MIIILYSSASYSSTPEEVKVSQRCAYYYYYYDDDDDDIFDGDGRTTTDILSSYHTGVFITSLFVRLRRRSRGDSFFFSEFKTSEKRTGFLYCCAVVVSPQRCYSVDACPEEPLYVVNGVVIILCVGGGENYFIIYKEPRTRVAGPGRREDAKSPEAPSLRGTRKNSTKTPRVSAETLSLGTVTERKRRTPHTRARARGEVAYLTR